MYKQNVKHLYCTTELENKCQRVRGRSNDDAFDDKFDIYSKRRLLLAERLFSWLHLRWSCGLFRGSRHLISKWSNSETADRVSRMNGQLVAVAGGGRHSNSGYGTTPCFRMIKNLISVMENIAGSPTQINSRKHWAWSHMLPTFQSRDIFTLLL